MSCCGGNCGCGAACKCGNGCGGCKMNPDSEATAAPETLVLGVAPQETYSEGSEVAAEGCCNRCCRCLPCYCRPCCCE